MSERSSKKHDDEGLEIGDPTPMQPPLGYKKSLTLSEQIAQQVRVHQLRLMEDMQMEESEEDADDFNVGEDFEPFSKYENENMPTLANLKKQAKAINDAIEKRKLEIAVNMQKERIEKTNNKQQAPAEPAPETSLTASE